MADGVWVSDVLHFWFVELREEQWWTSDTALDDTMRERFLSVHMLVAATLPDALAVTAERALAAIIVLDQFSRNMFRGTAGAFAHDAQARAITERAVTQGFDRTLTPAQRQFLYMPMMHAEDRSIHERSLALFTALGHEKNLKAAIEHKAIIDRFGRYPHRNAVLGRASTADERAYLAGDAKRFGQ